MDKHRLEKVEQHIFALFQSRGTTNLLAREIFESTDEFANADLVRAFEDLEKRWRLVVRHTTEGNDWLSLTPEGAAHVGLRQSAADDQAERLPHPPKSAPRR